MILYVKGADFSSANIGTLNTYAVRKSIGIGATYDIPNSVTKGSSVTWEITLAEDYTFGLYSVTMGATIVTPTVSGNRMTITIPEVTANIVISVATVSTKVDTYTFTINPTPSTATVKLTSQGYVQNGNSMIVPSGTSVSWEVSADGYTTQSGTHTVTKTETKNVTLVKASAGEDGIYPIGTVLDTGTVSIEATSIAPYCTTKGILEQGGQYEITITTNYSGKCSLYLGTEKGGSQCILGSNQSVQANTPFTISFSVPYLNYSLGDIVVADRVYFRSHIADNCEFTYSIKKTGYDNNPLEGVAAFQDKTVSAIGQRVYGLEAGCTYDYELIPSYTGTLTIYQAYSSLSSSTGSLENIGATGLSATANTPITGTITMLTTPSVTAGCEGRVPDTIILRSHQDSAVTIQYKFTKK